MSGEDESSGEEMEPSKRRHLTAAEKKRLLDKFYQLPQPCSQREAAAMLNISQATFSRLIGDKFVKKFPTKTEEVKRKRGRPRKTELPRNSQILIVNERGEPLTNDDDLHPCSRGNVPKARSELMDEMDSRSLIESDCRTSEIDDHKYSSRRQRPPRKRRRPKRFDSDEYETLTDTSDEHSSDSSSTEDRQSSKISQLSSEHNTILSEYIKLTKSSQFTQKEAAKKLKIPLHVLRDALKAGGKIKRKPTNSKKAMKTLRESDEDTTDETRGTTAPLIVHKSHKSLPEKIKIIRMFDAMQPCSQNKAKNVLNVSSSMLSSLIASRSAVEEEFRSQLKSNMEVLKKYDSLEDQQLPRAHRICGMPKPKLNLVLEYRDFWEEEAAKYQGDENNQSPMSPAEKERLEQELLSWYQSNTAQRITWMQLMGKARELSVSLGLKFVPTDSWMTKWKRKFSHLLKPKTESTPFAAARVDCVNESSTVLPALKDYHPDNIFNLDETGIYYKAMPGCAPAKDEWVTVLFICNMSGTEKKRLTVVGKSDAPIFFGILTLPLDYKHSKDGKMTQNILATILSEWDSELRAEKRNIALILDNCSMHINVNVKLDCISLFFVPNNTTTQSQPLNRGIISKTKTLFRKKLFKTVNKLADNAKAINKIMKKMTLLDSLYMLAEAWDEVPGKIIIGAFAELVFPNMSQRTDVEETDEDIERLNELDEELESIVSDNGCSRECQEDELSNEEYVVVHAEGVVTSNDGATGESTPADNKPDQRSPSELKTQLSNFLDSTGGLVRRSALPAKAAVSVKSENILAESLCKDLGLSMTVDKDPPTSVQVHEALGVIKRFLRMNGGTLEDFTDFTQLEMKVLSKMKT